MEKIRSAQKQKGAVLALFVIGLVAIIAMAGLALDVSHAYIDKTRLQNVLDATAMSGAMTLALNGNDAAAEALAISDAIATFDADLEAELAAASLTPVIEFSHTLNPFTPGSTPAIFVRARIDSYNMPTWLVRIIGKNTLTVGASAVSGPVRSETCNLSPLVICGDPTDTGCLTNPDADTCFGYNVWREGASPPDPEEECYLKTGTGGEGDPEQETGDICGPQEGGGSGGSSGDVGPGNYQLLDFSKIAEQPDCSGGGAAFLACALAKGVRLCPAGGTVPTKPGNTVGPVADAINTHFADYHGSMRRDEYPPDLVTDYNNPSNGTDPVVYYGEYEDRTESGGTPGWDQPADGIPKHRVKPVVIGDCTSTINGQGDVPVLATGCFFLTQPAAHSGGQRVWGQFIGKCGGNGSISLVPTAFTQEKIILYKDPDSTDS
jgi:hypothetical protein